MRCKKCGRIPEPVKFKCGCKAAKTSESASTPCSTLDEFELMDQLAIILGIAGPESQEERNNSSIYQRRVLRAAIAAIKQAWKNKA